MNEFNEALCAAHRDVIVDTMALHWNESKAILDRIEKQTTDTNGRVSALEKWKDRAGGAVITIVILVPLLTALLVFILQKGLS